MAKVFLHDQANRFVGVVGANGRITITCPSGCTVRVHLGETEHTAVADETGKIIFSGLEQGLWNVEINDGQQIITKSVEVVTEYSLDMEFLTATISIDYPLGSKCTCTNGVIEYEAPDTGSHWDCIVADSGTWTITCANGIRTETRVVEITSHGQFEVVDIEYFEANIAINFPVGSTCTCYKDGTVYNTPDYSGTSSITTITHSFIVDEPGLWTVSCFKNGRTEYRYLDVVSDGQTIYEKIEFFEATLDITYPDGCYCTCSCGDLTVTSPDTSGKWTYTVPDAGTWTVACVNNGFIKSKTVDVTVDKETKVVDIDYFLASINVLYSEDCECSIVSDNGVFYAPDASGSWVFEVFEPGTYTVACVTAVGSKTETVEITNDWQIEYVNLTEFEAYINITYPAGATCTCSDERTTYTATNTSGSWTLIVPRTGTWTVRAWNNEQEVSEIVTITGDGQHEDVLVKFFAATINITYPAGAVCTCTDGTTRYTAPDSNGYWELTVPRANEWLIQVNLNGSSISGSVNIERDGQIVNKTVKFFEAIINITYPVGATCICTDDNGHTYYAPDNSGSWNLKVPHKATWRISAELDGRNCGGTVEITADEQVVYKTIKFFAATIIIDYPAGYPCICYSSDKVYEYEAPDTSGRWELIVPCIGKWVFEVENDEQTASTTVEITEDEQVISRLLWFFSATVQVTAFEALKTLTCTDGITIYEYSDIPSDKTIYIEVPRAGIWTITGVTDSMADWNNELEDTAIANVTYGGQTVSVGIGFMSYGVRYYSSPSSPVHTAVLKQVNADDTKSIMHTRTLGPGHNGSDYFNIYESGDYELCMYREAPYDGIESNTAKFYSITFTITEEQIKSGGYSTSTYKPIYKYLPVFTYSKNYKITDDNGNTISSDSQIPDGNWNIHFLETGVLKFTELNGAGEGIDVFVCGGGGNGGLGSITDSYYSGNGGGGGGGGCISNSFDVSVSERTPYSIVIGGSGGQSEAFNTYAYGGRNGDNATNTNSGSGGAGNAAGGAGGRVTTSTQVTDGIDGSDGTLPFMGYDTFDYRYGAGGGGGSAYVEYTEGGSTIVDNGGSGFGGRDDGCHGSGVTKIGDMVGDDDDGYMELIYEEDGPTYQYREFKNNTGGGGGGGGFNASALRSPTTGRSGIVIIRNTR